MGFINVDRFQEFRPLQENWAIIRQELSHVGRWVKWGSDDADVTGHCRFLSGEWTVFPAYVRAGLRWDPLLDLGSRDRFWWDLVLSQLPDTFPQTTAILRQIPRVNWAAFSRLGARSKLAPHSHANPESLIYHLGIVIPSNGLSGLAVDGHSHTWQKEGDAVVFDDTYVHSAWNDSESERVILYMNFARRLD